MNMIDRSRRPKAYIAAAFRRPSTRDDPTRAYGEILDEPYIAFLERVEAIFLRHGYHVCLPHRDEGRWGKRYYDPCALAHLCKRHIQTSTIVFAIAGRSRGVHIELGYADGLG